MRARVRKALRWALRIVGGMIAFAILLVAIAIGAAHTKWGREKLRKEIEAELQAQYPGSRVGALEGSPFGTLTASGIEIAGRDGKPFISISSVQLALEYKPLTRRVVRIDAIAVEGVLVDLAAQPPPKPEPEKTAAAANAKPSSWEISMPDIAVHDAKVLTANGDRIDHIEIAAGISLHDGVLDASAAVTAQWRGQPVDASASVVYGDTLTVPYAHVAVGSASVIATGVRAVLDGPLAVDGAIVAQVPAPLVKQLADVELPGDAALVVDSHAGAVRLSASVGPTTVHGFAHGSLDTLAGELLLGVTDPRGQAALALAGTADGARGIIAGSGAYDVPTETGPMHVAGSALVAVDVQRAGDAWKLASALVSASGHSPLGDGTTSLVASGMLSPEPQLTAKGTVDGKKIRKDDIAVAGVHVAFDAKDLPARPSVTTRVEVTGIRKGALVVPSAALAATTTLDGDRIGVTLTDHRVVTADGKVWTGSGGTVAIDDQRIVVRGLETGTASSTVTANATIAKHTDDIDLDAKVKNVALAMLDPKLHGTVAADVAVSRHRGGYAGHANIDAHGVKLRSYPVLDGHVGVKLAGRRVTLDGSATSAAGTARIAADVTGPRDITDPLGWQRLERSALTSLTIGIDKLDAAALGGTGVVDGELTLTADDARGSIHAGNIVTKVGTVETTLSLSHVDAGAVGVHVTGELTGFKPVTADATVALPRHPFAPAEWAALGPKALRVATVRVDGLSFDKAALARLGVKDRDFAGTVDATATIRDGGDSGSLAFDLRQLRGPSLRAPIDLHLGGALGPAGVTLDGKVAMGKVTVELGGTVPVTLASLATATAQPIKASVTVPSLAAKDVLALLGRSDVKGGDVGGSIEIAGTLGAPTAHAHFTSHGLTLVPAVVAKTPPRLESLDVDARWAANHGEIDVTGVEAGGKMMKISARATVGHPESVVASIEAAGFDLAPVVAFAPGALGAARGTLDAALTVRGIDPQTGEARGKLHISEGRLPLAPTVGTLRKAELDVTIVKQDVVAKLDGKIGAGSVSAKLTAKLVGGLPTIATLEKLELRKFSPIGAVQPVIDADITGAFTRTGTKWAGALEVKHGNVFVPPETGADLLDTGAPIDMYFINEAPPPKPTRRTGITPWLVADIDIARTAVLVDTGDVQFDGSASGRLKLTYGGPAGLTLDGAISTQRGTVDFLSRRYQLDHGIIDFEGNLDPRLDIRLIHDFTDLTLTVDVLGHSSVPDVRLTGDPGTYTQGQLFAILAGAEPGGDAGSQAGQAVVGGGLSFVTSRLGRKVTKYLPFKVDTLNYEAPTGSSSGAVRAGVQLSKRSHLVWRQHLQPRPDENPGEAVLEYIIKPWALIEATAGERAGGGDILLRKRW